jgi:hypothetical protein
MRPYNNDIDRFLDDFLSKSEERHAKINISMTSRTEYRSAWYEYIEESGCDISIND